LYENEPIFFGAVKALTRSTKEKLTATATIVSTNKNTTIPHDWQAKGIVSTPEPRIVFARLNMLLLIDAPGLERKRDMRVESMRLPAVS
jgi:hypothetical protein